VLIPKNFLLSVQSCSVGNWKEGKFNAAETKNSGQLDHFDPILKTRNGWNWENFFVVDSDVNMKVKRDNPVDYILKPDLPNYNPEYLFIYNWKFHHFLPNPELEKTDYEKVKKMLKVLGINFFPIVEERKVYFKTIEDRIRKKLSDYHTEKSQLYQFFTAYEMSINYFNKLNINN